MKKIIALIMVMTLLLVGCQNTPTNDTNGGSDVVETKKFAVLLKPISNEYWMEIKEGLEDWAESKENVEVVVFAAESEDNVQAQLAQMENIISQDYDGIAIAPLTSVNLIPGILKANKAGIPVVNVDEGVDLGELEKQGGTMHSFVTTDNQLVGEKAARFIEEQIGTGEIALIEGTSGNVTSINRVKGASDYIDTVEGLEVVTSQPGNWDRIKSLDVAANIIQANPNIKAFYAANDLMALGVLQAVENAGKEDSIIVVGTDATAGAVDSIGKGGLAASVGQENVKIAIKCIENLITAISEGYEAVEGAPVPIEYIDSYIVTSENVKEY